MHHIIYLSYAVAPFTNAQLQQLLTRARRRNTELGVTGILLYGNERFVQILEGEEYIVQELYERIKQDPRHTNLITFATKPVEKRAFAEWAMAFQPVSSQHFDDVVGYLGPLTLPVHAAGLSHADENLFGLLRSFVLP